MKIGEKFNNSEKKKTRESKEFAGRNGCAKLASLATIPVAIAKQEY
jgi:hypothetical protein